MVDLNELQKRTTRQSVLGGHGLDVVNMHGSDFDALIAELRTLRARVSEADELQARAEASVAIMSAEMTAARELIGVQWWLLEHPLCGSRSFMDGLRRAFEARERDARLGAMVRKAVGCMNAYMVEGHTTAPGFTLRQERIISVHQLNVLRAIADALRAEEGGKR